jgi:WD40 repeat protein
LLVVRQQEQREAADLATAIAEAGRLDDAARNAPDVGRALLLAVEAHKLHDSADTRAVLADLLAHHAALIRSVTVPGPVQALAVSPDGSTLLVGAGNNGISTYSTGSLNEVSANTVMPGWTMEYRNDGQQLLLAGRGTRGLGEGPDDLSAALTDRGISVLRNLQVDGIAGGYNYAKDAAYSADGRMVAVAAMGYDEFAKPVDSAVLVWEATAPDQPILRLQPMIAFGVALSPDGGLLYAGTSEPALRVIDVRTGEQVNSIPLTAALAQQSVTADTDTDTLWDALSDTVEVSPDGNSVAVAEVNDVVIYNASTLTEKARFRGHSQPVRSLQFSHDGRLLVSGSADRTAVVWDVATGREVLRTTGHADTVLGLAFSPDDSTLYTGGLDRQVLVWDLSGRRRLIQRIVDGIPHGALGGVAAPSPDGNAVAYVGPGKTVDTVRFLDVPTGRLGEPVVDPNGAALAAWQGSDNERVVTVADRSLRVRDRGTGELIKEVVIAPSEITAIATIPGGDSVVIGDRSGGLQRVDTVNLSLAGPRIQLDTTAAAVAAKPDGTAVAMLDDKTYVVVDLAAGDEIGRGDLTIKPTAAALSPDGSRLAIGGSAGEVGLLDLDAGEWIARPNVAHRQYVDGVAFSADGQTLVTTSFDAGVRLWNGVSGEPIAGVQVGQDPSAAIAVVPPDGTGAIVATRDGEVYRLDTRFEKWTEFACTVVARNFTTEEWLAGFGDQPYRETCPP